MIEITKAELIILLLLAFLCGGLMVCMIWLTGKLRQISSRLKGLADRMKGATEGVKTD